MYNVQYTFRYNRINIIIILFQSGSTALHCASNNEIAEMLIKHGCNIHALNKVSV